MREPIITMTYAEYEELQKVKATEWQEVEAILQQQCPPAEVQEFLKTLKRYVRFLKFEEVKRLYGSAIKEPQTYSKACDEIIRLIEKLTR